MVEEFDKKLIINPPTQPNFFITAGEEPGTVTIELRQKRSISNRVKWWLFCMFFPFKITKWEDL